MNIIKVFYSKFQSYKDRKLRERCVKYAISQPPTPTKDVNELAVNLYNYIKDGSYNMRL